jgi:uncharacterized protein YbbC (DUF1343 family)
MPGAHRIPALRFLLPFAALALAPEGCSSNPPRPAVTAQPMHAEAAEPVVAPRPVAPVFPVMLGIDVLQSEGFAPLVGKRIGLLTHRAGVNRLGVSTITVLRNARGVKFVSLFACENGLYGDTPSGKNYADQVDPRTGILVHSLYGRNRKPTAAELHDIDAFVIDLQDVGARSYTFVSAMKVAMEACFENNVEVVVLDRPNPLSGLKVDGPPLDPKHLSYVGEFPVPYVHGLTIGELARLAKYQPGVLQIPDDVRQRGRLTVIPMRGWKRGMRWSETGLAWVPTSPMIPNFPAVVGYPMTGLGSELSGFVTSKEFPFRGISHKNIKPDVLERELAAFHIPGLQFRRISVINAKTGLPGTALFIEISDWDAWRPTELSFYLMKLACKLQPKNPFAGLTPSETSLFVKLTGSPAFLKDIAAHGASIDVDSYIRDWQLRAALFQEQSRRYWIYP